MHERPTTLAETEELIVRVEACKHDAAGLPDLICDCNDTLDELYAIRAALIPEPRGKR